VDCVFCKIRDGVLPATKVYEDDRVLAVLDIHPLNDGHTLVLTKAHAETLWEADPEDLAAAVRAAQVVARAIREALKPDGLNVLQANGRAAFQSVPHFHLHLVPRWEGDGRGLNWELVPGQADRIRTVGEQIRAHLQSGQE
jgi:histidine triad (HIT) family protein